MYVVTNLMEDVLFGLPDYEEFKNYCKFSRLYISENEDGSITVTNSFSTPLFYVYKVPFYSSAMEKIEEENEELIKKAKSKLTKEEMRALDLDCIEE